MKLGRARFPIPTSSDVVLLSLISSWRQNNMTGLKPGKFGANKLDLLRFLLVDKKGMLYLLRITLLWEWLKLT